MWLGLYAANLRSADWLQYTNGDPQLRWGLPGGLQFAIHPAGFRGGDGGPRGLIRLGYPVLTHGGYDLINFIAVEPVVRGRRGFSELEPSQTDGRPGKLMQVEGKPQISKLASGRECMTLRLRLEKFANGAHVSLELSQWGNIPDELTLTVLAESDSAPLDYCILTATMGNFARARQLWLRDRMISSRQLYPHFQGTDFAPHTRYGLSQLARMPDGSVIATISTDEDNPSNV